ncbi:hypothetical protein ACFL2M_02045 [Patescibacteria group bacterium]
MRDDVRILGGWAPAFWVVGGIARAVNAVLPKKPQYRLVGGQRVRMHD